MDGLSQANDLQLRQMEAMTGLSVDPTGFTICGHVVGPWVLDCDGDWSRMCASDCCRRDRMADYHCQLCSTGRRPASTAWLVTVMMPPSVGKRFGACLDESCFFDLELDPGSLDGVFTSLPEAQHHLDGALCRLYRGNV